MMELDWWQWLAIGIALMLLELVVPFLPLLWAALAAVLVAVAVALFPLPTYAPLAIWLVAFVLACYLQFRFRGRSAPSTEPAVQEESGAGVRGVLLEDIDHGVEAKVLLQKPILGVRQWVAVSDESIGAGERVYVISRSENRIRIARALLIDLGA